MNFLGSGVNDLRSRSKWKGCHVALGMVSINNFKLCNNKHFWDNYIVP